MSDTHGRALAPTGQPSWRWLRRGALTLISCAALVACGGDDGSSNDAVAVPATVQVQLPAGRQAAGSPVQMASSLGTQADGLTVRWDFGDGNTSSLLNPLHVYTAPGVYTVTVTVTNNAGDQVSGSSTVTVGDLAVAAGRICTGADQTGWCWQRPLPQGQSLRGFEWASDTHGWAVGDGGTIMTTRDGGKSWQPQHSGTTVGLREVRFVDTSVGWAIGGFGEVLRTTDGGANWQRLSVGVSESLDSLGVQSAQVAWLKSGYNHLITRDGGSTWQTLETPPGYWNGTLTVTAGSSWSSGSSNVWRRLDGGAWAEVALPAVESPQITRSVTSVQAQGRYALVLAYEYGYLGDDYWNWISRYVAWVSQDSGVTWQALSADAASGPELTRLLRDGTLLQPGGYGGTVTRYSSDLGRTWRNLGFPALSEGRYISELTGLDAKRYLATDNTGLRYITVDAGTTWTETQAGGPGNDTIDSLWFFNSREGVAVGRNGSYLRTQDGGITWTVVAQPNAQTWSRMAFLPGADIGWVVSSLGTVYKSIDRGATWLAPVAATSATINNPTDVHFVDAKQGWVVTPDTAYGENRAAVYRSVDGGSSWQPMEGSRNLQGLRAIRFADAANGVAMGPAGVAYVTTDGGARWQVRPTGSGATMARVTFANANLAVAVGAGGTILRSTDRGVTWQTVPSATAQDLLDVRFTSSSRGYAVGAGGTLLTTNDGGLTWTRRPTGVSHTLTSVFFVDAYTGWVSGEGGTILVTTDGG